MVRCVLPDDVADRQDCGHEFDESCEPYRRTSIASALVEALDVLMAARYPANRPTTVTVMRPCPWGRGSGRPGHARLLGYADRWGMYMSPLLASMFTWFSVFVLSALVGAVFMPSFNWAVALMLVAPPVSLALSYPMWRTVLGRERSGTPRRG